MATTYFFNYILADLTTAPVEFRQYIRGWTTVEHDPDLTNQFQIRLSIPGGGARLLHKTTWYEDGEAASGRFYGHRLNAPAPEGKHYSRNPATQADTAVGAYLDCGVPENGFARMRCGACRAEYLEEAPGTYVADL